MVRAQLDFRHNDGAAAIVVTATASTESTASGEEEDIADGTTVGCRHHPSYYQGSIFRGREIQKAER